MKYTMNFGRLASQSPKRRPSDEAFRIAVLGDFSGRANARKVEVGRALAGRVPRIVDIDNFEAIFRKWDAALHLPIGAEGATVEVEIESLDDFHPDQLYSKLEIFQELSGLRRRLKNTSTFPAAAAEMQSWLGISVPDRATPAQTKPRGTSIPPGQLSDFARLIGGSPIPSSPESPADELIRQIVAPYIVPAAHSDQNAMITAVDEALSTTMRRILHNPDFQALEALWRSVDLLTRELESGGQLQVILYDITAEEIAADVSSTDTLESSGIYQLVVEQPAGSQQLGLPSVLLGNYVFDLTPPHAELLGRIGKVAAVVQAPFIAGVTTDCLIQHDPADVHPLISESWATLRQTPQANYLGLTVPRFMLRWPYGAATEPIESFRFEEFTPQVGLRGMLWANGSILAGLLLGKTFGDQGMKSMKLGSVMTLGDVPFYYYIDSDGDQVALPSTERLVSEPTAVYIMSQNFMPVLSIRGRPEVRLGGFVSLSGAQLAGPWAPLDVNVDQGESLAAAVESPSSAVAEPASEEELEARAAAQADQELDALLADDTAASANAVDNLMPDSAAQATQQLDERSNEMDPDLAALLAQL